MCTDHQAPRIVLPARSLTGTVLIITPLRGMRDPKTYIDRPALQIAWPAPSLIVTVLITRRAQNDPKIYSGQPVLQATIRAPLTESIILINTLHLTLSR